MIKWCILFTIFLVVLSLSLFGYDLEKIDPLFCSYFADSFGVKMNFEISEEKYDFDAGKESYYGILHFPNAFESYSGDQYGIICKGISSVIYGLITDAVIINDSIVTGYASFSDILDISDLSATDYIEISKPMFQSSDSGAYYTKVDVMKTLGYTGKGILIGYIDDGFESDLNIFKKNGISKFKYIWNQKLNRASAPSGFFYGEEIDSSLVSAYPITDTLGHGTAVLALLVSESEFSAGLVPSSRVLAVNALPNTKSVIEAIKYIYDKSSVAGAPCVTILPMNHFWGRHDGTDMLEQAINGYYGPNVKSKAISVPSGNLGNMLFHFSANIISDFMPDSLAVSPFVLVQSMKDFTVDIDLVISNPINVRFFTKSNGGIVKSSWIDLKSQKTGYYSVADFYLSYNYSENYKQVHIKFEQSGYNILGIEFADKSGSAEINGYISQGGYFVSSLSNPSFIKGDFEKSAASPSFAVGALTSSSYVSRRVINDNLIAPDTVYHITSWSGFFPDGLLKPDVYSPGKYIYSYGTGALGVFVDDNLYAYSGTSFSSAFTGAALAMLFESDSLLTTGKIYNQIRNGADLIPYDIALEEGYKGYGFLNVLNSLKTQTVDIKSTEIAFCMTKKNQLKISLSDLSLSFADIKKKNNDSNKNDIEIISNQIAIDKNPILGKNIYVIKIIDYKGNTMEQKKTYFMEKQRTDKATFYFDITGRKIDYTDFKRGVLFERSGEKIRKILKF